MKSTNIADEIGVNKSTISRELSRNKGQLGWRPRQAQELCNKRRMECTNAKRFTQEDWECVGNLIRQDMSPHQAAEGLALEGSLQICHETIYQYIYVEKRLGGDLWQHLRSQKPRCKRYASGQEHRGMIQIRVSIDERHDQKTRLGDWEGDTVIGKNHRGALVTLAERKSRYVLAAQVFSKHAVGVTAAITRLLRPHKKQMPHRDI